IDGESSIMNVKAINLQREFQKLRSGKTRDRKNAAWFLGNTKDRRAVEPLIQAIKIEKDRFVRKNIVTALAKIGDKRALKVLKTIRKKDPDEKVRREASWAIRKINTNSSTLTSVKLSKTVMKTKVAKRVTGKTIKQQKVVKRSQKHFTVHPTKSRVRKTSLKQKSATVRVPKKTVRRVTPTSRTAPKPAGKKHPIKKLVVVPKATPALTQKKGDSKVHTTSSKSKLTKTVYKSPPVKSPSSKKKTKIVSASGTEKSSKSKIKSNSRSLKPKARLKQKK
ncbi:MAG: hypothetical protein DRO63_04540, partial [Candidatus Gerdarchaeota archaeon]